MTPRSSIRALWGSVSARPPEPGDEAFLYTLYSATRADEFSIVEMNPRQLEALVRMQYEAQKLGYQTQFPDAEHTILLYNGEAIGRLLVNESPSEILLVDIALLKTFRGQGLGTDIVRGLMERAAQSGKPLRHSILRTNEPALRTARRLGHTVTQAGEVFIELEWQASK